MNPTSLPPFYQDQIRRKLFDAGAKSCHHVDRASTGNMTEPQLQSACEQVLGRMGYWRLTEKNILKPGAADVKGWYFHLHDARRESCLPDLVIFEARMTRCLCVELKATEKSAIRKAQKAMIGRKCWRLAFDLEEFAARLNEWEGGK